MARKINKDKWVGIKYRNLPEYNYAAIWNNLVTVRLDKGDIMELPPDKSEFYDVSLGTKCTTSCVRTKIFDNDHFDECKEFIEDNSDNVIYVSQHEDYNRVDYLGSSACPFCYVSANPNGKYYEDICETWKKWMSLYHDKYDEQGNLFTLKPAQIAIGSQGEPLEHPSVCEFLKTVYETDVVPNYTTNGVILSYWNKSGSKYYEKANEILAATSKFVGGVAVSFGNKALRPYAKDAIEGLFKKGNCHVMIHHIISTMDSVDEFVECWKEYGNKIKNHVLLPLMPSGRSKKGIDDGVFEYLEKVVKENNITNVAFGAHFIKYLEKSKEINTWLYPAESYSKNVILTKDKVQITPSSFDLKPIKIIDLANVKLEK